VDLFCTLLLPFLTTFVAAFCLVTAASRIFSCTMLHVLSSSQGAVASAVVYNAPQLIGFDRICQFRTVYQYQCLLQRLWCLFFAGAPSSSAPSMATVSEHSSSAGVAVAPSPAADAAAGPTATAASAAVSGVSGNGASSGSTTSSPGVAPPPAGAKEQLSAASEGGGGARKPRRRPAPAAINPFAAANAARQLKATSAPAAPKCACL
jgi:hypothetical protein